MSSPAERYAMSRERAAWESSPAGRFATSLGFELDAFQLDAIRAGIGVLAYGTGLLVVALISPRGMGMGDVKLAGFIGIGLGYLGWGHVVLGLFGGFLLGGVISIVLMITKVAARTTEDGRGAMGLFDRLRGRGRSIGDQDR